MGLLRRDCGGQGGIVESVLLMAVFWGFVCADICQYMTVYDATCKRQHNSNVPAVSALTN